jgi:hypothetical protein
VQPTLKIPPYMTPLPPTIDSVQNYVSGKKKLAENIELILQDTFFRFSHTAEEKELLYST